MSKQKKSYKIFVTSKVHLPSPVPRTEASTPTVEQGKISHIWNLLSNNREENQDLVSEINCLHEERCHLLLEVDTLKV